MPLSLTCWLWFPPRDCSLPVLLACCESLRRGFGSGALFGLLRSFWGLFGLLPPAVCGPCRAGRHGAASERLAATATAAAAAAAAAAGECRESGGGGNAHSHDDQLELAACDQPNRAEQHLRNGKL